MKYLYNQVRKNKNKHEKERNMKHIILYVFVLFASSTYASECRWDVDIELLTDGQKIDLFQFSHISKGSVDMKKKKVYSFPILYKGGQLYTTNMQSVNHLSANLIFSHREPAELNTVVENINGAINIGTTQYVSPDFYEEGKIFTYDVYFSIDHECALEFSSNFHGHKYEIHDGEYKIVEGTIFATM
jgi:hypothetical protein